MTSRHIKLAVLVLALAAAAAAPAAASKLSKSLIDRTQALAPGDAVTVWVYFTDKGPGIEGKLDAARAALTPRARARRLRNRQPGAAIVDARDIAVEASYIDALRGRGVTIRHASRWLNAVSAQIEARRVGEIAALDFVRRLDVVRSARPPEVEVVQQTGPQRVPAAPAAVDYGNSFTQNDLINTIPLHDLGYTGSGVLVCMLDAGFNNLEHEAFSLMDIMITRDFVNGDSIVTDQSGQAGTGNHGTYTLSALGGWAPGEVIGPAWGATFALAKTENTDWERHIEEDHWVAGAEWADSLGADIISSSLGYRYGFTDGETGYEWTDMDGNTAITTIGADIAASKGILVVNSAGNNYYVDPPQNTLIAPADGDSVLAVGAVDGTGARVGFSSVGLSADGRIKPDVMAMGSSVRAASPSDPSGYVNVSGTSLSCPLVAGAAALLLEVNPDLSNMEIIDALRSTASQSGAPDRLMGYGIVDVAAAAAGVSVDIARGLSPAGLVLHPAVPNPFNPTTTIAFELPEASPVTLAIYDVQGRRVRTLVDGTRRAGPHAEVWNGERDDGRPVPSGVYFYRLTAAGAERSRKMVLLK